MFSTSKSCSLFQRFSLFSTNLKISLLSEKKPLIRSSSLSWALRRSSVYSSGGREGGSRRWWNYSFCNHNLTLYTL